jgi:hypothetical protein
VAKHTPGPWVVNDIGDVRTGDGQDRFIASVFGRGLEEKTANARLIAAAPELLHELEEITHLFAQCLAEQLGGLPPMATDIRQQNIANRLASAATAFKKVNGSEVTRA